MKRRFSAPAKRSLPAREQKLMDGRYGRIPRHAVVAHHAPERERIEFRRNHDGAAGEQRRDCGSYKAVHMKQRHGAERNVVRREVVCSNDVVSRRCEVLVAQWHALWPAGATAGVEDERNIVGLGHRQRVPVRAGARMAVAGCSGQADKALVVHFYRVCGNSRSFRCFARVFGAVRGAQQDSRGSVRNVEAELLLLIAGIERRGGACDGGG